MTPKKGRSRRISERGTSDDRAGRRPRARADRDSSRRRPATTRAETGRRALKGASVRDFVGHCLWALRVAWSTDRGLTVGIAATNVATGLTPAGLALAARGLINSVDTAVGQGNRDLQAVVPWLVFGLAVTLAHAIAGYAQRYILRRLDDELSIRITTDILQHADQLDLATFEDPGSQDRLDLALNNAAGHFTSFLTTILAFLNQLIEAGGLLAVLIPIEPLLALAVVIAVPPFALFQWLLAKREFADEASRSSKRRLARYFVTHLTSPQNVPEVKLLGLGPLLTGRFRDVMSEFRDRTRDLQRRRLTGGVLFAAGSAAAFYATFALAASRAVQGILRIGDVAIYAAGIARFRSLLESAMYTITAGLRQVLFLASLRQFLGTRPGIPWDVGQALPGGPGEVVLESVTFTYPGSKRPALRDVSLRIRPGETIALVGENGAGKSTLAKLLARLYDPDHGRIMLDGKDLRKVRPSALHRQLSFVFQEFGRYEASAADNIAYGDWSRLQNNRSGVEQVARSAHVHELVEGLPEGYDTMLGRMFGRHTLSGGQWQRIAVARAFARAGRLLILDEPTANLDAKAEERLFGRFRALAAGRTTILISHRFTTVGMADRIAVLEKGQIVEVGTHRQLLARAGPYAALYRLQRGRRKTKRG